MREAILSAAAFACCVCFPAVPSAGPRDGADSLLAIAPQTGRAEWILDHLSSFHDKAVLVDLLAEAASEDTPAGERARLALGALYISLGEKEEAGRLLRALSLEHLSEEDRARAEFLMSLVELPPRQNGEIRSSMAGSSVWGRLLSGPDSSSALWLLPRVGEREDQQGLPTQVAPEQEQESWFAVQVAAFPELGDAQSLLGELGRYGFVGYVAVDSASTVGLRLYRVRLGPYRQWSEASSLGVALGDSLGLSYQIVEEKQTPPAFSAAGRASGAPGSAR